jgi:hypothetical protein
VVAETPPVAEEVAVDEEGLISDNASVEDTSLCYGLSSRRGHVLLDVVVVPIGK